MDVQILVETTFDDGSIQRRDIGRLDRTPNNLATENLGLRHDEAKGILKQLQEVVLQLLQDALGPRFLTRFLTMPGPPISERPLPFMSQR